MRYLDENTAIVKVQKYSKNFYKITIPKKFRDKLGWKAGDDLDITVEDDVIVFRKATQ